MTGISLINSLTGLSLELICFAEYNTFLHFSESPKIFITTTMECIQIQGIDATLMPKMETLHQLVGKNVDGAEITSSRLVLHMSSELSLIVNALYENFENYIISVEGDLFVS